MFGGRIAQGMGKPEIVEPYIFLVQDVVITQPNLRIKRNR